jgi:leader peptidase (prepilin peptidase) / N-methyltransferase
MVNPYEALARSPAALAAAFVFGALWGSFANVCIYRLPPTEEFPHGRSVVRPGSHCFACGKPVRWYDNVPLLAYLWLRGKCRDCGAIFSPRYLLVEALTGVLFAVVWWLALDAGAATLEPIEGRLVRFFVYAVFTLALVVITFIDLDHKLILDKITYPAIPVFWALGMLLPERSWSDGLIGAAVGYGVVRLIADGYWLLTKREGMGYGDGKLLAVIGALLGWKAVIVSLFGGAVIGSVIGVAALVIVRGRADAPASEAPSSQEGEENENDDEDDTTLRHAELPFGPFIAAAAFGYLVAEPWLSLRFFG